MRQRGQTGTEYMLVISVIVVSVVGGSYAFVPPFQEGVNRLGYDIKETLGTGSFRGQGRMNATVHDTATNPNTLVEGGEGRGTANFGIPFLGINIDLQPFLLAQQKALGGAPPTGIGRNSCGEWAVSYIFNELGIPDSDMSTLMAIAEDPNNRSILLDCKADGAGACTDLSMDRIGLNILAQKAGGPRGEYNPHDGAGGDYAASKTWLEGEIAKGAHPAVLVTDERGQPHWAVMTGVVKDPATGTITGYTVIDGRTGEPRTMSRADFQDSWAQQGNVAVSYGAPASAASASK